MRAVCAGSRLQDGGNAGEGFKQPPESGVAYNAFSQPGMAVAPRTAAVGGVVEMKGGDMVQAAGLLRVGMPLRSGVAFPYSAGEQMAAVEAEGDLGRLAAERAHLRQLLQRHAHEAVIAGLILDKKLAFAVPAACDVIQRPDHQPVAFQRIRAFVNAEMDDDAKRSACLRDVEIVEQRFGCPLADGSILRGQVVRIRRMGDGRQSMLLTPFLAALGVAAIERFDAETARIFGEVLERAAAEGRSPFRRGPISASGAEMAADPVVWHGSGFLLAIRTKEYFARRHFMLLDRPAAAVAFAARTVIDFAIVVIAACRLVSGLERMLHITASGARLQQHGMHRVVQPREGLLAQRAELGVRAQLRFPGDLVGIAVADAGDDALVHQHRLQGAPLLGLEPGGERGQRQSRIERLGTERGQLPFGFLGGEQMQVAEPQPDEIQVAAVEVQLNLNGSVGPLFIGTVEHPAPQHQMQKQPFSVVQMKNQMLSAPLDEPDRTALQPGDELSGRKIDRLLPLDGDLSNPLPGDGSAQQHPIVVHFRIFRHEVSLPFPRVVLFIALCTSIYTIADRRASRRRHRARHPPLPRSGHNCPGSSVPSAQEWCRSRCSCPRRCRSPDCRRRQMPLLPSNLAFPANNPSGSSPACR
ncbi:hypothetical protein BN871_CL_00330 [Paenibacillus sp. P22]|nr:hypothetical protein BN871_CL_00330 [Paenibacillus sp. P22]